MDGSTYSDDLALYGSNFVPSLECALTVDRITRYFDRLPGLVVLKLRVRQDCRPMRRSVYARLLSGTSVAAVAGMPQ